MTKKDFIALADLIRCANLNEPGRFSESAIRLLADFCATQNPNFKRGRWLDYIAGKCGPGGGNVKVTT